MKILPAIEQQQLNFNKVIRCPGHPYMRAIHEVSLLNLAIGMRYLEAIKLLSNYGAKWEYNTINSVLMPNRAIDYEITMNSLQYVIFEIVGSAYSQISEDIFVWEEKNFLKISTPTMDIILLKIAPTNFTFIIAPKSI